MNTVAFAEAIQIKVMEGDESYAVDEVCLFRLLNGSHLLDHCLSNRAFVSKYF